MTATLIVTADDYGLTAGTSRAILAAHRNGVVTATSVLVLAPGARDRLAWLDDAPGLAVGVHLALVGEDPPLLSAREVPTLVGRRGGLAPSWRQLLPRLAAGRIDPTDVRRELGAQVEAVRAQRTIDHLDSHQHVHLWPSVAAVVVGLAEEHGIGRVRVPRPSGPGPRARLLTPLAERLDARVAAVGVARTDRFRGVDEAGGWTEARLVAAVTELGAELGGSGSAEVNAHPGPVRDPDRGRYAWDYGWAGELEALGAEAVRRAADRAGLALRGTLGEGRP